MTKTISIIHEKGGVGKTTSAMNIGAGLVKVGKKEKLIASLSMTVEEVAQMEQTEQNNRKLGRFGNLWIKYMKLSNPKQVMELEMNNSLYQLAEEKDQEAQEAKQTLIEQMKLRETAPTDLLERTQWENQIRQSAEEMVIAELLTPMM